MQGADVDREDSPDQPVRWGPVPVAVYAAMLAATMAGQAVGMLVDWGVVGHRAFWVPIACSVGLEAVAGARFGAARIGKALSPRDCGRVSVNYSLCLGALSLSVVLWGVAAGNHFGGGVSAAGVAVGLGTLVVATFARWAAMVALSRGPS